MEELSGKKYGSTLPGSAGLQPASTSAVIPTSEGEPTRSGLKARAPSEEQIAIDIAFRVIADHIRTLSFAIADGIQPGNNDRNYVLRRILRRAVRYGRTLGFHEPFFHKLVDGLADTMGDVFPEIRAKQKFVREVILGEETTFNRTLGNGLEYLETILRLKSRVLKVPHSAEFQNLKENIQTLKGINIATVDEANVAWFTESCNAVSQQYSFLPEDFLAAELRDDAMVAFDAKAQLQAFADFWRPLMKKGDRKSTRLNS